MYPQKMKLTYTLKTQRVFYKAYTKLGSSNYKNSQRIKKSWIE